MVCVDGLFQSVRKLNEDLLDERDGNNKLFSRFSRETFCFNCVSWCLPILNCYKYNL
jgi:hypothetical protein